MKKLSFIIPVFRNQGSLKPTYDKILNEVISIQVNYDYEFIFVNDGSDDDSLNELIKLHEADSKVKVISFSRNFGQVPAIVAGLKAATGDLAINMSADLQDPPKLINDMIEAYDQGNEIVICYRLDREDTFISKKVSALFYGLMNFANNRIPKGGFDFLLLGRKAIDSINQINERNRFFQGDIMWLGFPVKYIPYKRLRREIGKSQWTLSKKVKYFIDGMLNTSYLPIRFMTLVGIISATCGFIYTVVIVYNRLINNIPFKGWAPIMILILIIGGLIMLMLGVIGEYIWRIYDETRNRPYYIIDRELDASKDEKR
jgi:dolichol-phosphate mannosyltransferase